MELAFASNAVNFAINSTTVLFQTSDDSFPIYFKTGSKAMKGGLWEWIYVF